jgi:predicted GIY-YIG superfamily endonuclease
MRDLRYIVYILRCSDGTYYTGMTSDLEARIAAHQMGLERTAYTYSRRPIVYQWSQEFGTHDEAFHAERQIKGWSRAKKEALIRGDLDEVHRVVR